MTVASGKILNAINGEKENIMPGTFAHMIAADQAKSQLEDKGIQLPSLVLNSHPQWFQSGAVGPDYPYLHNALTSHDKSDSWADLLHYTRTGDVVRSGINILRARYTADKDIKEFQRALAWLYGYASHVVLDASIHPVVRAIVGEYEENKTDHRVCEMYMDSYIYRKTYGIELNNSEWVDYLRSLTDPETAEMDNSVVSLWQAMLKKTYPDEFTSNFPQINSWHKAYVKKLDVADVNIGFFRHAAGSNGLLYVPSTDIPSEERNAYIDNAKIPSSNRFGLKTMCYDDIFNFGVKNVAYYLEQITSIIEGSGDPIFSELPNWNLDKGTVDQGGIADATLWV